MPNLMALLLFLSVCLAYGQTVRHGFILFDDPGYVTENRHIQQGINGEGIRWAFTGTEIGHWHPVTWISHMLDVTLFGLQPSGHHLMNCLLHGVNVVLLFFVLRMITGGHWQSFMVAAFFALHPLNVESVAWVSERKNVLSTLFWMLTLCTYGFYVRKPNLNRYIIVFLIFLVGLAAKPMLVTLPFVLLMLDFWPLRRWGHGITWSGFRKLFFEKTPFFLLSAVSAAITLYAAGSVTTIASMEQIPLNTRIANALIYYLKYFVAIVIPRESSIIYPYFTAWSALELAAAVLVLSVVTWLTYVKRRCYPYLLVGWCWFLLTLQPVIGIIQVGSQSIADRYVYIPAIGIFIMATWGIVDIASAYNHLRPFLIIFAVTILLACFSITIRQAAIWQNSVVLFGHAVARNPNNYLAHYLYGQALYEKKRFAEATREFNLAVAAKIDFAHAYRHLGLSLAADGRYDDALRAYDQAGHYGSWNAELHLLRGNSLLGAGNFEQAVVAYDRALSLQPQRAEIHNNLGLALRKMGRLNEARDSFLQAVHLQPTNPGARNNLAMILLKQGDDEGAIYHFREALRLEPNFANAHYFLGAILMRKGRVEEAQQHLEEAAKINPLYKPGDYADAMIKCD